MSEGKHMVACYLFLFRNFSSIYSHSQNASISFQKLHLFRSVWFSEEKMGCLLPTMKAKGTSFLSLSSQNQTQVCVLGLASHILSLQFCNPERMWHEQEWLAVIQHRGHVPTRHSCYETLAILSISKSICISLVNVHFRTQSSNLNSKCPNSLPTVYLSYSLFLLLAIQI